MWSSESEKDENQEIRIKENKIMFPIHVWLQFFLLLVSANMQSAWIISLLFCLQQGGQESLAASYQWHPYHLFLPPCTTRPRTTDTFKDPILLISLKWQNPGCVVQYSFPVTMLDPVDILISTSAFAQADVLTSHRKEMMTVKTKSWRRKKKK